MLSDGALRMLVLLHFNALGFTPIQLAYLFLLYEVAGIVTNLAAGWIAARFGLTSTLYAGLLLQIGALVALAALDPSWSVFASVTFVMAVQGVSGIAKDLAKMSSKSAVKVLAPKGDGTLFRWVAALTGSKNAVKGLGFFLGAALLAVAGFHAAVWGMAGVLTAILIAVALFMPEGLPPKDKDAKFTGWRSTDPRINKLSLARMFLFGARDVWFVVGVPIYFQMVLSDGTLEGRRWAFFMIGGFLALWIIAYGAVQAAAPRILHAQGKPESAIIASAIRWAGLLVPIPFALALLAYVAAYHVLDAASAIAVSALRGYKKTVVPMLCNIVALWGLGLAGGYVLAFGSPQMGAAGFWIGATAGVLIGCILIVMYFLRISRCA